MENNNLCMGCKQAIQDGARFCGNCGMPVPPITPQESVKPVPPQEEKKNKKAIMLILALVMAFIVLVTIVIVVLLLRFGGRITVPDLSRSTVAEAESILDDLGLDYRIRERFDTHERIGKDLIISHSPDSGEKVQKKDRITFEVVISQGPAQVSMPNLFGVEVSKATQELEALGLVIQVEYDYVHDVDQDHVMAQSPIADTVVENGERVTLYVSLGLPPVQDITFANNAMKIRVQDSLGISGDTITNEDVLAITDLDLSYLNLTAINELIYFTNLTRLDLSGNLISDVSPLDDLQQLAYLFADDNSIQTLQNLPPNVSMVSLNNNLIEFVGDLSGYSSLESLYLYNNYLDDLPKVPSGLRHLDVSLNFIADSAPLAGLTTLEYLDLSNNAIDDISILAGLSGLSDLNISFNNIYDFTAIDSIYSHLLYYMDEGNPNSYLGGSGNLGNLFIDFDDISIDIYGKSLDYFTDYTSDYYLEGLEYQGEYEFYNQTFYGYYFYDEVSEEGIRIFFDEWGRLQAYYLHIWDLHYDTIGYYYPTVQDAVSSYGAPYTYSLDGLVYVTDQFIYEFFDDGYGYLTDALFAIYRTDSRMAIWE